jgi:menaquinone-specific isochorismate synthase
MATGFLSHEAQSLSLAQDQVAERVEHALREALAAAAEEPCLLRVEIPVSAVAPLAWLRAQRAHTRVYWSDRDGIVASAGVGEAHAVRGERTVDYDALVARLRETLTPGHPNLAYYGGLQFDSTPNASPQWGPFGSCYFVIPRFELFRIADATRFACTIVAKTGCSVRDQLPEALAELHALATDVPASIAGIAPPTSRKDFPEYNAWANAIGRALAAAQRGEIEKVVLARESRFTFNETIDPVALLERLANATPNSYHFCFQPSDAAAFIGASPERLFRREGRRIESEALAGTRPRGADEAADLALGDELMHCDKDIREHRFVFDALRPAFAALCDSVNTEEDVALIKLQVCQHLWRSIEGTLRDAITDADILRALHPTPAVGGYPTEAALRLIPQLEPFHRGWYAGPVGRVTHDATEFAVAIRSGLVQGTSLAVYSGAGILPGSRPEAEWAEIENKMGTFLGVLSGGHVG